MKKMKQKLPVIPTVKFFIVAVFIFILGIVGGSLFPKEKELKESAPECPGEIITDCDSKLYLVSKVIDGDTIKIKDGKKVRLIGIDAPEKGECYYSKSADFLRELLLGKYARLEKDISEADNYDRWLRYVIIPADKNKGDNILVNDYLVKEGQAKSVSSSPDLRYRDLMATSQQKAIRENKGIWKACQYEPEYLKYREQNTEPPSENCLIKGNISERGYGKTYLLPGCDNYKTVKIDLRKGEQYFCSEEEAQKAGFRKATNCP